MSDAIQQLIEDYKRRIENAKDILDNPTIYKSQFIRVEGKLETYRLIVHDLESIPSPSDERYKTALEQIVNAYESEFTYNKAARKMIDIARDAISPNGEQEEDGE